VLYLSSEMVKRQVNKSKGEFYEFMREARIPDLSAVEGKSVKGLSIGSWKALPMVT